MTIFAVVADAVGFEPVSSLQIWKMQGDFVKMQGRASPVMAKSCQISEA